jgi:hypothetical protein
MENPPTPIVRTAFVVHLVAALFTGIGLLFIPYIFAGWFGYALTANIETPVRGFGAMILAFGGVTSLYGATTRNWNKVDYIVRGEISYLAVQTILCAVLAAMGIGPALGNWLFTGMSAILLVLFVAAWFGRPK